MFSHNSPRKATDSADCTAMEAGSGHSSETRSYRIRLRKLDGQSVIMGGELPADSPLHTLAEEIVKAGHADAGKFSIVFPQLQSRLGAIYDPSSFDASLESCGVFETHMTLSLQKFAPAAAKNWSPPPPLVRGTCPRGRIDSKKVRRSSPRAAPSLELQLTAVNHCLRKIWNFFMNSSLGSLDKNPSDPFKVRLLLSTRASGRSKLCMKHI